MEVFLQKRGQEESAPKWWDGKMSQEGHRISTGTSSLETAEEMQCQDAEEAWLCHKVSLHAPRRLLRPRLVFESWQDISVSVLAL